MVTVFVSYQTHLPVDAVLKAERVRRGAEDWQLQNEPLDRRRSFLFFDLSQKKLLKFFLVVSRSLFLFLCLKPEPRHGNTARTRSCFDTDKYTSSSNENQIVTKKPARIFYILRHPFLKD